MRLCLLGRGGCAIKAEGVCRLVLPGVRKCAPFEGTAGGGGGALQNHTSCSVGYLEYFSIGFPVLPWIRNSSPVLPWLRNDVAAFMLMDVLLKACHLMVLPFLYMLQDNTG